jgi:hypothetical protein
LWLIKVWFSASTFVVKIATFAKPETVDFLVIGGDMGLDELKLSLLIGGNLIHEVSDMKPIRLANLPKGTHQISLILKRNNGKELEGPFSIVSKSVIVR